MQILKIAGSYMRPAHQPIIAKVFRDRNQPDTGLSPAVEEITRAVMCRKARAEGHMASSFRAKSPSSELQSMRFAEIRLQRERIVLHRLSEGPATRQQMLAILGMTEGHYFHDVLSRLVEAGQITRQATPGRQTILTITDAGRAHVAAKVTAE